MCVGPESLTGVLELARVRETASAPAAALGGEDELLYHTAVPPLPRPVNGHCRSDGAWSCWEPLPQQVCAPPVTRDGSIYHGMVTMTLIAWRAHGTNACTQAFI